jgi:2-hydroxychromene-2-carboxylate isomerase
MTERTRSVRFYFDYISSNAYLAWTQLPTLATKHAVQVELVPVLFAGLLNAHGQLGPAEVPFKAWWMYKNNLRKALLLGVPLNPPAFHPFNPLLALRVSSVPMEPDSQAALIDALFKAVWVRGLHVSEPAVVTRVLSELGLDARSLIARATLDESKARLRAQTDDAIRRGVFGVPSMEVDGEVFWGYDDFPYLDLFLAGKDPLAGTDRLRTERPISASAQRRRSAQRRE